MQRMLYQARVISWAKRKDIATPTSNPLIEPKLGMTSRRRSKLRLYDESQKLGPEFV
jgi:hypothetical protein